MIDGGSEAVNMYGRHATRSTSKPSRSETQKPPTLPRLLAKVPTMKSTSASTPVASARPRPCSPRTPIERSEEHTSELQSLMRTSYAVFCLKKIQTTHNNH